MARHLRTLQGRFLAAAGTVAVVALAGCGPSSTDATSETTSGPRASASREAAADPTWEVTEICAVLGNQPNLMTADVLTPEGGYKATILDSPGQSSCSRIFEPGVRAEAFFEEDGTSVLVDVRASLVDASVLQAWITMNDEPAVHATFEEDGASWKSPTGPTIITRADAGSTPSLKVTVG